MNTKFKMYFFICLLAGILLKAQENNLAVPQPSGSYVFGYDEAGNQIYRGYNITAQAGRQDEKPADRILGNENISEEEKFWNEIRIYPVPVKDVLTIDWTDTANELIDNISLYEQNTIHWKFRQKNIPNLDKLIQVDMSGYYMGVYILTFQLKDGRVMTRNITKF